MLTSAAASTDAISYLGLGHVFPANMTGNTVLLAIGIAGGDYAAAGRSGIALASFVASAALAGLALRRPARLDTGLRLLAGIEFAVLGAAGGWWLATGAEPAGATRVCLIALTSAAMGLQSGAIARLDAGTSTTYVTGTWTAVSTWAGALVPPSSRAADPIGRRRLQLVQLGCYFGAALLSGYVHSRAGAFAVLIPLVLLLLAVAAPFRVRLARGIGNPYGYG